MDSDPKVIAAVLGLVGTGLAALISSIGYYVKTRNETRKTLRKVLYYLLEIHYAMRWHRLDPSVVADKWISYARTRLSEKWNIVINDEESPDLRNALTAHMSNIFSAGRTHIDKGMVDLYYGALLDLAQTHPILAYRLRGKEKLEKALAVTEDYHASVIEQFIKPIEEKRVSDSLRTVAFSFKNKVVDEALEAFHKDIVRLAWKSGIRDYLSCLLLLRKMKAQQAIDDTSELDVVVDTLAQMMIEELSQKGPLPDAA